MVPIRDCAADRRPVTGGFLTGTTRRILAAVAPPREREGNRAAIAAPTRPVERDEGEMLDVLRLAQAVPASLPDEELPTMAQVTTSMEQYNELSRRLDSSM